MRLVTYIRENNLEIGSIKEGNIIPFSQNSDIPNEMLLFLEGGEKVFRKAEQLCKESKEKIQLSEVTLLPPISRPPKILAIGLNYADHLEEVRAAGREMETPIVPMVFNKQSLSVAGPYDEVHDPKVSEMLDFEGELTFVIG
ncbi:uncharacterized protein METZ01_LOCUS108071, partial [marine metagenome]